ncbi:unnamed protein product, partial [Rotaria magnacalcarata]
MTKLLEKDGGSLRRNEVTSTVARVKTLNTFRQLDAHRNVQIIRFLYEAKQLTDTPENLSLDLSTAKLFDIDFRDAAVDAKPDLSHPQLSNVKLHNTTFASAILASAVFHRVKASFMNFTQTTAVAVRFELAALTYSNFSNSNIKRAIFWDTTLKEIDFSRANLYKVLFPDTDIEDVQLERALSIHGAELCNGTRVHGINLINDGQFNCTHALINGWTLKHVNVTVVMSNQSNNNCHFNIQPLSIEATMYKRINLLDKWDSSFWSYSQAEFNASMSTGVAMELSGINSNDRVVPRESL